MNYYGIATSNSRIGSKNRSKRAVARRKGEEMTNYKNFNGNKNKIIKFTNTHCFYIRIEKLTKVGKCHIPI